jgi:hypothetical protein
MICNKELSQDNPKAYTPLPPEAVPPNKEKQMKRYMIGISFVLLVGILSVYGGQPKISVDSAGWRNDIEDLQARMAVVEQKNTDLETQIGELEGAIAILQKGQIFLTQWELTQLSSQILEAGQFPPTRGISICDLNEPDGDLLLLRDDFITAANAWKTTMETQLTQLQP